MYPGYSVPRQQVLGSHRVDVLGNQGVDILGYGDTDILGALRILGAARGRGMGQLRASGAASNGVRTHAPSETRRLGMPIDSGTTIAGGASATISVTPLDPFRTEALSFDPSIAASFIVTGATVGRKSQLNGSGALACTLAPPTNPFPVQWDTAQTSQPLLISVTNTSSSALRFMGQLLGTVVSG